MLTSIFMSLALSAVMVPPGESVVNHAQPAHYTQPTIQRFERRNEDTVRRMNWELYSQELEQRWHDYRQAGSTPIAWGEYKLAAARAKRRYLLADPYLLPFEK